MAPPRHPDPDPGADRLSDLVAEWSSVVPADVPDGIVTDGVLALLALRDRVDAQLARWVGAFDGRTIWTADGARSAGGWLAARTDTTYSAASATAHAGRVLRSCPHTETAWVTGRIGTAKARLLLDAQPVHPDRFAADEAWLIDTIEPLNVRHARTVIARWTAMAQAELDRARADDTETEPDPEPDQAASNSLHLSQTFGGRYAGTFDLDPIAGTLIAEAIAAAIDTKCNDGSYSSTDDIAPAKRRADALVELVTAGAAPGERHGEPRPSVALTIGLKTLLGLPASTPDDALTRRCELDDGTPITRSAAERLMCTATITAMLTRLRTDGTIETIGITDHQRHANRRQRRALRNRDGGCIFPGCNAPEPRCHAHHLDPFPHGPTLLHNLVLLCSHHHHTVHEGGWQLWRDRTGTLHLRDPNGRPVELTPHGHKIAPPHPDLDPARTRTDQPPPRPAPPRFATPQERAQAEPPPPGPPGHPPG
jgi:hypothetical protein